MLITIVFSDGGSEVEKFPKDLPNKEERRLIRKLMMKLTPILCSQSKEKHGIYCPTHVRKIICCWYCDYLESCVKIWRQGKIYCRRYQESRWCSAACGAYEELMKGAPHVEL